MTNRKFIESLAAISTFMGDKERQVEQAYNAMLIDAFPGIHISNPYKCDGYFTTEIGGRKTGVIMEYKYNIDFSSRTSRSGVLAQVVFYLKRFEKDGKPFPAVVLIGDVNECFVIHSNHLLKFLDIDGVDWSVSPSSASSQTELVLALASDETRNEFVYDIGDGFDFSNVVNQIEDCAVNVVRLIRITEHNVDLVFKLFCDKIVKSSIMSPNDLVGLFLGCIVDSANNYLHPKKKGILVTPNGEVKVNHGNFLALISHFDTEKVSPVEKKRLSEICDRLIEDTTRRKKGEFYTPTAFVDYAHKRIEKVLGENWKDEYVVWDCCCGTKNLTRDYRFKELYCSTLEKSELDISEKYNPEAVSFQFDFLNDDFEKLPDGLKDAFRNKNVMFLINPPFGTTTFDRGVTEKGNGDTKVNDDMEAKDGFRSKELIVQFLWKIDQLLKTHDVKNYAIGLFSNPKWMTGKNYRKFRKEFLERFKYESGFMFKASHFSDVSGLWGITFNIWTGNGETADKVKFTHDLIDVDETGMANIGTHDVYNKDEDSTTIASYVSEPLKGLQTEKRTLPIMSRGIMVKNMVVSSVPKGIMGTVYCLGGDVQHNNASVIMSGTSKTGGTYALTKENFLQSCVATTVRNLIPHEWMNDKDEYFIPDSIPCEFMYDCVTYQIFKSWMVSISLPNGERMPNEFFWMGKSDIENLANENSNDDTYNDARMSEDRFVYKFIQDVFAKGEEQFSPEAKEVLDKATELVRKSFKYRFLFDQEHPEYCINAFDAGWYQIKAMLKQYMPDELKEFKSLYRKLSDKLLPQVYNLGFLRK